MSEQHSIHDDHHHDDDGGYHFSAKGYVIGFLLSVVLTGLVCWLFLNGFVVAPRGELSWQGHPDATRIGFLLGAAVLGTLVARIINALGAHHRMTSGDGPS